MLKVFQKVVEGKKERLQSFTGRVITVNSKDENTMITVRQIFEGIAVDRIYPLSSPVIAKIEKIEEKKKNTPTKKRKSRSTAKSTKSTKKAA